MLNNFPTVIDVVIEDKDYFLNFTLQDANGVVVNLTGATLAFNAQLTSDPTVQFSGVMVIQSAIAGTCYYQPIATDFPIAGNYNCQVVVNYTGSGEQITFDGIQVVAASRVPQ